MARVALAATTSMLLVATTTVASAHHPDDEGPTDDPTDDHGHEGFTPGSHDFDMDGPLLGQDEYDVISGSPFAKVTKNLAVAGRGERLEPNVTTDVWAHGDYAYTGTFSTLCSDGEGGNESGVWIWDVHNNNRPTKVGVIESAAGAKANDVKVFTNTAGDDILVMSNESCDGGPGGVDVYNVNDPASPEFLTRVQVDDANAALRDVFGVVDTGVHNMFLWSRDGTDYMGASGEGDFGNFKVFDITEPTAPTLVSTYGPEEHEFDDELAALGVDSFSDGDAAFWTGNFTFEGPAWDLLIEADGWLFSGFGASANRIMHDLFISDDGTQAYVNFWDGGLFLLDITDPSDPTFVSQALDPTSTDGEVNSHSVWTTDDGSIVVEGEEDFAPYETEGLNITSGPDQGNYTAFEFGWTKSIASLDDQKMDGPTRYAGRACDGDEIAPAQSAGELALVLRGACRFDEKTANAQAAGYAGIVIFTAEPGDAPFAGGGEPDGIDIPGVMVGHEAGLLIAGVDDKSELVLGAPGADVSVTSFFNGWSGLRIWDYSDPENPVLASTFDTACSALPLDDEDAEQCMEGGTYSSHNVIIEDGIAYVSWYFDGLLMIDISDPYNPVEVGRYHERGEEFEEQNAGPQDIWGVHKLENEPWVYASDRNGGLYVLKAFGQGSAKNGKAPRGGN